MAPDVDIAWAEAAVIAATAFLAGVVRGYSGFGSALTIVPVMAAVVGPQLAVPAVVVAHFATGFQLVPGALRDVDWGRAGPLSAAGVVGVPAGAWLLATGDPELIRRGISILIILFAILMLRGWRYRGKAGRTLTAAAGAVGGAISGAATIGGPPVVMFLLAGPHRAFENRGAIIFYFQITQVAAIASYWIGGLLVWTVLWLALLATPTLMAGAWIGERLFRRSSDESYRRLALLFLLAVGLATLFA